LLSTEGVDLEFTDSGVQEMARMAATINKETENIGARRLHTILETILEEISFEAPDKVGEKLVIDIAYVKDKLDAIIADSDLSKFILLGVRGD
jgi:ATP-dependent HslUV protease ATP-binding subunit HslU